MKKFIVTGTVQVQVTVEVPGTDAQDAITSANYYFGGLSQGVSSHTLTVSSTDETVKTTDAPVNWTEAQEK